MFGGLEASWNNAIQTIEGNPPVTIVPPIDVDNKKKQDTKKRTHQKWHNMTSGIEDLAGDALDGLESLGSDIVGATTDVFQGAYHAGQNFGEDLERVGGKVGDATKTVFHGGEKVVMGAIDAGENVFHKVGSIGSDIEHTILIGGAIVLGAAILWSGNADNRQWAYDTGKSAYQKGKRYAETAAAAAII